MKNRQDLDARRGNEGPYGVSDGVSRAAFSGVALGRARETGTAWRPAPSQEAVPVGTLIIAGSPTNQAFACFRFCAQVG